MGLAYTTSLATSGNGATTGLVPRITSPMIPTTRWDQNTASAGYYAGVLTYVIAQTATVTGLRLGVRIRRIVPLALLVSGVWTVAHEQQLPNHAFHRTASPQTYDGSVRLTAIPYFAWANRTPRAMYVWLSLVTQ